MREENLKLILADIDGTLVNEARNVLPLTRDIINHIHTQGVLFGIASGRPADELERTFEGYRFDFEPDILIGMNGGEMLDQKTKTTASFYPLQKEEIREILQMMEPFEDVNPVIYRDHMLVAKFYDDLIRVSEEHAHKKSHIVRDLSEFWEKETGKIMFRTRTPEECTKIEDYARSHLDLSRFAAFRTQPTLLEVQNRKVNKGMALLKTAQRIGLDPSEILAFGDASNDNEMLREAGLGVCLINGLEDTKASADLLTDYDNEEDGMARFLLDHFPGYFEDFQSEYL